MSKYKKGQKEANLEKEKIEVFRFNAVWACSGRYHVEAKIYTEPSKYGIVFTSNNVITDGFSRTRSGRIYDA